MARVPQSARDVTTDEPLPSRTAPAHPGEGDDSFLHPPEHTFEPVLERRVQREVPADAERSPLVVRDSDCDLFQHVNNAQYLRYFEDALGRKPSRADVEYRGQAVPGDVLTLCRWDAGEGRTAFALERGDEVLCRAVLLPRR
jgi:acyl-ACP thioesterase